MLGLFLNWGAALIAVAAQSGPSAARSPALSREAKRCVLSVNSPKFLILAT